MSSKDCRIYVGNLPQFVKKHELQDLFDRYGKIHMIDIHNRFDPAFAFIEFDDPRDAEDAIYGKNGSKFQGQYIKCQFPRGSEGFGSQSSYGGGSRDRGGDRGGDRSRGNRYIRGRGSGAPIRRSDNRVLVSGLPATGSWQDLKDHMREAGEVLYTDVYKDGTAVVEFSKYKDMKWAVKYLDDSEFESHQHEKSHIRVKRDGPESSPSRSPSPSRRRSRSRSPYDRRRSKSPGRRSRTPPRRYSPSPRRYSRSP